MTPKYVTVPELALIAGTRAMLGVGVGLLMADRLDKPQRQAVGWTLFAVGVLTTFPLAAEVIFGHESQTPRERGSDRFVSSRQPAMPQA